MRSYTTLLAVITAQLLVFCLSAQALTTQEVLKAVGAANDKSLFTTSEETPGKSADDALLNPREYLYVIPHEYLSNEALVKSIFDTENIGEVARLFELPVSKNSVTEKLYIPYISSNSFVFSSTKDIQLPKKNEDYKKFIASSEPFSLPAHSRLLDYFLLAPYKMFSIDKFTSILGEEKSKEMVFLKDDIPLMENLMSCNELILVFVFGDETTCSNLSEVFDELPISFFDELTQSWIDNFGVEALLYSEFCHLNPNDRTSGYCVNIDLDNLRIVLSSSFNKRSKTSVVTNGAMGTKRTHKKRSNTADRVKSKIYDSSSDLESFLESYGVTGRKNVPRSLKNRVNRYNPLMIAGKYYQGMSSENTNEEPLTEYSYENQEEVVTESNSGSFVERAYTPNAAEVAMLAEGLRCGLGNALNEAAISLEQVKIAAKGQLSKRTNRREYDEELGKLEGTSDATIVGMNIVEESEKEEKEKEKEKEEDEFDWEDEEDCGCEECDNDDCNCEEEDDEEDKHSSKKRYIWKKLFRGLLTNS